MQKPYHKERKGDREKGRQGEGKEEEGRNGGQEGGHQI